MGHAEFLFLLSPSGGRRATFVRKWRVWEHFTDFFPIKVRFTLHLLTAACRADVLLIILIWLTLLGTNGCDNDSKWLANYIETKVGVFPSFSRHTIHTHTLNWRHANSLHSQFSRKKMVCAQFTQNDSYILSDLSKNSFKFHEKWNVLKWNSVKNYYILETKC